MNLEVNHISIESLADLMRCITLASLLELAGYPKPGNVHRTQDFKDTRFEHFLAGISAIQPNFKELCERVYLNTTKSDENYSFVKLGVFFKDATEQMMKWQEGGNVLLGHILILAPLAAATAICLKREALDFKGFSDLLIKIINDATVMDTIQLYEAIRTCNPGGLGKIDKYDLNDNNSIQELKADKITLKKIFDISRETDLISFEYSMGFHIILNEGLPFFIDVFNQTSDINVATVETFIKILAEHNDTLIIKKSGMDDALMVSKKASEIIKVGGVTTKKGNKLIIELDKLLQEQEGKLNPGTTADLIAGIIFCALILGLKY